MIADALYVGDTSVGRVMLGDVEVWSAATSLPVVTIAPGGLWSSSRDQFRAACVAYGTTYQTVVTLPFLLDTSQVTGMNSMFGGCSKLATVPDMDTSKVTDMAYMFNNCVSLTAVPDMDASKVTNVNSMFRGCSLLTDGNVRLIGKHPSVNVINMIEGSGLTREPFYDANGNPI